MFHDRIKGYHQARGLRTDRYRFNVYEDENGLAVFKELFDLINDPLETVNLINDPVYTNLINELGQKLERV